MYRKPWTFACAGTLLATCTVFEVSSESTMKRLLPVVAAASLLFAAGGALAQDAPVTVKLDAQNGSGETGTATFTPQGNKTQVVLQLTGAPSAAQPAHIHEGSCAKLNP